MTLAPIPSQAWVPTAHGWHGALTLQRPESSHRAALCWLDTSAAPPAEGLAQLARQQLSPAEWALWAALPAPARQRDFLLGRLAARQALATWLGLEGPHALPALDILPGVFGQPIVQAPHGAASRLGVSISHCAGVACALAHERGHPMAVDVEREDAASQAAMAATFTAEELAFASTALDPHLSHLAQLTQVWSAREALGKVLGCGLTVPSHLLEVQAPHTGPGLPWPSGPQAGWYGHYRHFIQYGWHAWRIGSTWLTLALPRRSQLQA